MGTEEAALQTSCLRPAVDAAGHRVGQSEVADSSEGHADLQLRYKSGGKFAQHRFKNAGQYPAAAASLPTCSCSPSWKAISSSSPMVRLQTASRAAAASCCPGGTVKMTRSSAAAPLARLKLLLRPLEPSSEVSRNSSASLEVLQHAKAGAVQVFR